MADEIIRQVAISCSERGLLLLRIRDEIRMTLAAYQTLYESSIAFGMRKALQAEHGKADMETKVRPHHRHPSLTHSLPQIGQLEQDKRELEAQVNLLKAKNGVRVGWDVWV